MTTVEIPVLPAIQKVPAIERQIAQQVVTDLLAAGFVIVVSDGTECVLKNSSNLNDILSAMFSTDGDVLIAKRDSKRVGMVAFIWGNGCDVIHDWTDGAVDTAIQSALSLSEQLANSSYHVVSSLHGHRVYFRADAVKSGLNWTANIREAHVFTSEHTASGYAMDLQRAVDSNPAYSRVVVIRA